jgi:hypothetical protein
MTTGAAVVGLSGALEGHVGARGLFAAAFGTRVSELAPFATSGIGVREGFVLEPFWWQ